MTPNLSQEPPGGSWNPPTGLWHRKTTVIAARSIAAIVVHVVFRIGFHTAPGIYQIPLLAVLALSGAVTQEVIDVLAVLNALRAALPPRVIHDL